MRAARPQTKPSHDFKVGDVVKLNSDGPFMAVETVGSVSVHCVWIHDGVVHRSTFVPETLVQRSNQKLQPPVTRT